MIPLDQLEQSARIFRMLSNPLRFRILDFLDVSACPQRFIEIVKALEGVPQAIVWQQLRILKKAGLLESQRDRNCVFYRIVSPEVRRYLAFLRKS
jgi:DNA-binding transcriptional ArsR family regulator